MKRIVLCILGVMAVSTSVLAQAGRGAPPPIPPLQPGASQADVDTALLAAPANLRDQATVIKWKPDFTYDTLRKGTTQIVCYNKSGMPKQQPYMIECTALGNLDRQAQNLKFEAMGEGAQAMFDAAEKDGTRVKPQYGSVWYHVMGPDKEHPRVHMTIAVPGATTASTGLPDKARQDGVWIMNAGTTTAHLMTPGE